MRINKNIIINVSLALFALALVFLALELTLRLTVYNFPRYRKSPGPNSTYRLDELEFKTVVRTNSLNIRDEEILPKKNDEFRILCLGDSYTFGLGVDIEEAFVTLSEELLNQGRKESKKFNLINGGGPTSSCSCLDFFLDKGLALDPDMLIFQTYIGNDFYDALLYSNAKAGEADPDFQAQYDEGIPRVDLLKKIISQQIYTLDFIWNRLIQIDYIDDLLFRFNFRYGNRAIYLRELPEAERHAVASQMGCLQKIKDLCRERGIRMLLFNIPDKPQVFKREFFDQRKYDYRNPNQIIKDFCRDNDIPYLDLLDHYEKLEKEKVAGFYYVKDIHWTKEGHRDAAGVLAGFIKEALE
ncbi:SGNH/GDSL hydrolase family protein [Candidatus Omnitrophota bacterium]